MKHALILVDIQNDYFPGGKMELVGIEAAAQKAQLVLNQFRTQNQPIFHIQHIAIQPGATFFLPDTKGVETHASVAPLKNERIIQKHFPSAFRDTPLLDELKEGNIDSLVICGAMSHMCIDTTVRAAFDLGFNCTVISDACATRALAFGNITTEAPQVHAAFMAALGSVFAQITEAENFNL